MRQCALIYKIIPSHNEARSQWHRHLNHGVDKQISKKVLIKKLGLSEDS
jgi:hypothetical protein